MNMLQQVNSWTAAQGKAGNKGLHLAYAVCQHMMEHRDWTPAARLLTRTEAHAPADAKILRQIMGKCLSGVTVKDTRGKQGAHAEGFVFTPKGGNWDDAGMSNEAAAIFGMAQNGLSFRSKEVKDFLSGDKAKAAFELEKYAKQVTKRLKDEWVDAKAFFKVCAMLSEG
jgi:hypothetical protein